ncbi:bifunctional adenosylcobinamide kinase/adenosylcobinamide-phosphate guanylyltransferase [Carboxylicivirga sp. M1479]|uniref:bifunctional adenosylcobinamide kinase/adenosylcobinamide-phosphate guanylyltransferase n=1 Tax=Carboxylicivirga sp. M1479 TaxID=2594476 RepID=UPI001177BFF1|nr:bifunctional adenosylcobinamide kinase/adenosylcobinamide-phosphate guanylyltransferase [Carboxylicivirga sp. M1479]TRX70992.1 bifunctional adenosylcobinamide kinase/adenosylcobinamide-phosphate guanylyltransferase [Carboxylicivirga sp. M1479]
MAQVILITGGQRSGKSSYAQKLALQMSDNPIYMATSRIWDEEHQERIKRHQADRGAEWTNIEEDKKLSKHPIAGRVVLIDCVTLWLTNYFFDNDSNIDLSLQEAKNEFNKLLQQEATFIFVSNEIGLGGMPADPIQRKFTDLQGWMNQHIAQAAVEVYMMVSGIPLKVK